MEYTKTSLMKAIHKLTDYTYAQIEAKYNETFNKHPQQAKYYARKAGIRVLQWWLTSLREPSEEELHEQAMQDIEDEQSNAGINYHKNHELNI